MEKTKLEICAETFPQTDIWMDSFSVRDHEYAVAHRCKGVTTSPTWVGHMLCDEYEAQTPLLRRMIAENPAADEREIAWKWTLEMGRQRSGCMLPEWEKGDPRRGRFRHPGVGIRLSQRGKDAAHGGGGPRAGAEHAGEDPLHRRRHRRHGGGHLSRRQRHGHALLQRRPGARRRRGHGARPRPPRGGGAGDALHQPRVRRAARHAGGLAHAAMPTPQTACSTPRRSPSPARPWPSSVYTLYRQRGLRTRMLVAYYRHHRHWSAFMGGDLMMTIPCKWQRRFEACDVPIADNIGAPVPGRFHGAADAPCALCAGHDPRQPRAADFDAFPPVILTLRYFHRRL